MPWADAAALALAQSRYVQRAAPLDSNNAAAHIDADGRALVLRHLEEIATHPWDAARMAQALAAYAGDAADPARCATALRQLRRRVLLALIVRDVAGAASLDEVVRTMTLLAELAVQRLLAAHGAALAAAHGVPRSPEGLPQDLLVVAMGKGGGVELNVSSDLDLVFAYDEDGTTAAADGARVRELSNHEYFERLGRRLNASLGEITGDGFIFRIDMRLRPNGDAGPLAVSTAMLEEYFVRQGRAWERFAWLKGRVISAAVFADAAQFAAQCRALEQTVRPFVYRKYLDFGALAALRELHALIRAETQRKDVARGAAHRNVKLGRGGIREIEFIAQTFQVIRGGREARLTGRSTLGTLEVLASIGALAPEICARLASAYVFLRRVEHALQYVDDAQTHVVPADANECARVAALLRLPGPERLLAELDATQEFVGQVFDETLLGRRDGEPAAGPALLPEGEALAAQLADLGYMQPVDSAARVDTVLAARRVQSTSDATRAAIRSLIARAITTVAAERSALAPGVAPDEVLLRFLRLVDVICGRSTYVALLAQYPQAFARVLRLLGASRWAADYLVSHPILLDELLDERVTQVPAELTAWREWAAGVRTQLLSAGDDAEQAMNRLRDAHHAQIFRLLLADLDGKLTVERLADHLSALADAALDLALEGAWQTVPRRHRDTPAYAVIGYGKLGGKELGYASDLDLVLLYDDRHEDADVIYGMLTRRFMNWLTASTSSGVLFDIDLRLRPDGAKGLLVSPFAGFERYERNDDGHGAWTWEHQALTRARFCAGDAALGARFEALRDELLARPRDLVRLRDDVLTMRQKMLDGHPNRGELFDLKHDRGGMVDIEFGVQYLVLAHAHAQPRLLGNLGNIALLRIAAELGLIDAGLAARVGDAYREFRRLQHRLRLNGAEVARVAPEDVADRVADVRGLWREIFGVD